MSSGASLRSARPLVVLAAVFTLSTLLPLPSAHAHPADLPISAPIPTRERVDQAQARALEVVGALLETAEMLATARQDRFAGQIADLALDYAALLEEPAALRDWYLLSHADTLAFVSADSEREAERQAAIAALPIRLDMLAGAIGAAPVHAGITEALDYARATARWQTVLAEE